MKNTISTNYDAIINKLDAIDPVKYGRTRNFTNGAVTELSPYVSRGVINGKLIFDSLIKKGYKYHTCEKFIQQLLWREYFQRVWQTQKDKINADLKQEQSDVNNAGIPHSIINATTSIEAIDDGIKQLTSSGMMHNHIRMYTAFLSCNLGKSHWLQPAKWMYYHLLDGDWGSNALSWQWVVGSFSHKKYIANQENINYYTNHNQSNTFLDVDYEQLALLETPSQLKEIENLKLTTQLPITNEINISSDIPVLIYNYYNLSPSWRAEMKANRILLIEPDIFKAYPVSDQCISFMMNLSKNIDGIQVFVGNFSELKTKLSGQTIYFMEHPLNSHYEGIEDEIGRAHV